MNANRTSLAMGAYPCSPFLSRARAFTDLVRFIAAHPLTKHDPVRALVRVAIWQIRSRIQREVIIPWVGNQKLCEKRRMTGASCHIYICLHVFVDVIFVLYFLTRRVLFIDIGESVCAFRVV